MGLLDSILGKLGLGADPEPSSCERKTATGIVLDIDFTEADKYPNALDDMYNGKIDGICFRRSLITPSIDNLEQYLDSISYEKDGVFREDGNFGYTLGRPLTISSDDDMVSKYFPDGENLAKIVETLFDGKFEPMVNNVFSKIAGGREVSVAKSSYGIDFKPCHFRVVKHGTGVGVPIHFDHEFTHQVHQIRKVLDESAMFAYFVVIQEPEEDGQFRLYKKLGTELPRHLVENEKGQKLINDLEVMFKDEEYVELNMKKGDMLVFDGRIWHKVTVVKGNKSRISAGGFASFSKDNKKLCYYA